MSDIDIPGNKSTASAEDNRYKTLMELAADGIMLISSHGIITEVNESLCSLVGLESDNICGIKLEAFPFSGEKPGEIDLLFQELKPGQIGTREMKLKHSDGSGITVIMRSRLMPDGSFQSIFHDITEIRQFEEDLKLKSMFLEAVVNSSADGILVVDPYGKKVFQNNRTVELWKLDPEVAKDPDGSRQVEHVMKMTKNPEQFFAEIEHQKTHPYDINKDQLELIDGTVLDRHSAPVTGEEGKLYGRIYHFHDITQFKRAEEKIRRLLEEKEIILKEVHHRVKNYMSTLSGMLTFQASILKDPSAKKALQDAQNRIINMMTLYDKLYVKSSSTSISAAEYFPGLIDEIISNFPNPAKITVDKDISDFILDAKTLQVLSIITNELLTNIIKYAFKGREEGKIFFSLKKSSEQVTFRIGDNGSGMPDNPDSAMFGSGLGLLLVKSLTEQLEGRLTVKNDQGTKVCMTFKQL